MKALFTIGLTVAIAIAVPLAGCKRATSPATNGIASESEPASAAVSQMPATAARAAVPAMELPEDVLRAYVWSCDDGQKIVMRNLLREKAIAIDLHDGTRRLEQTASASGARYQDAFVTFWTKGGTATLERRGAPLVKCTELREESMKEDARLAAPR